MPTILDKIVATKHSEIERAKAACPEAEFRARLADAPPVRDFFSPLAAGRPDPADRRSEEGQPVGGRHPRRLRSGRDRPNLRSSTAPPASAC